MATVIVKDDAGHTVMEERSVRLDHLNDEHCSMQLLERLAWAIKDAEERRDRHRQRHRARLHAVPRGARAS